MSFRVRAPRASGKVPSFRPPAQKRVRNVTVRGRGEDEVAGPYAAGLLELAQERNILENVYSDLTGLQSLLSEPQTAEKLADDGASSNELREFLRKPLQAEARKEVIDTVAKEQSYCNEVRDFLKLLVDTNRFECLEEIVDVFERRYNELTDTQIVTLRSAARLKQDQEFQIAKQLQQMTRSKNIKIKPVIDTALIGGFIVEFGDNKVDLSIKGHLNRIRANLLERSGAGARL